MVNGHLCLYVYTVYTRETAHIPVNVGTWTIMDLCEVKEVQNKKLGHDLGVKTPPQVANSAKE